MILIDSITSQDVMPLIKIHTSLNENDVRFYHPCKMNTFNISMFVIGLFVKSNFSKQTIALIALDYPMNYIAGFAFVKPRNNKHELGIVVQPYYRSNHIGKLLMEAVRRHSVKANLDSIFLGVLNTNVAAIKLYQNCGFKIVGKRNGVYKNENRIYHEMELNLNGKMQSM